MPRYTIQAPDGRTVTLEGESPPTEADLDQVFAQLPPVEEGPSQIESGLRGGLQGITLGGSDEIAGGIGAVFDREPGETFEAAYARHRDESRAANQAAQEANPWTYGISEFASGFALPGLGAARAAGGAAKATSRLARAAGVGAGYGGTAGAGYSEADTGIGVAEDAVLGAALGAGLGAGVERGARGLQRARQRYSKQGRLSRVVADSLDEEGITPSDAARMLRDDKELVLGDLTLRGRRELAEMAVEDPDGVGRMITERNRRIGQRTVDREFGSLDDLKPRGNAIDNAYKLSEQGKNVTAEAERLLGSIDPETAEIIPGRFTERLLGVKPGIFRRADRDMRALGVRYVRGGSPAKQDEAVMARIHSIQSQLRQEAKKGGVGAGRLRDDFLNEVGKFNQPYVDAVRGFGREKKAFDAVKKLRGNVLENKETFWNKIDLADESSDVIATLRDALPAGKTRDDLMDAVQTVRMMGRTRDEMVRRRNNPPGVIEQLDRTAGRIKTAVWDLVRSMGASRGPGSTQLAVGTAYQKLIRTLTEEIPIISTFTGGAGRQRLFRQALSERMVPAYRPARQRGLEQSTAAIAGGLAAGAQ